MQHRDYFSGIPQNLALTKKELCHGNGIRLITVYYDYDGIVNDEADIFYYSQDLSKKSEQPNLIALFYTLLHMIGIDHVLCDEA